MSYSPIFASRRPGLLGFGALGEDACVGDAQCAAISGSVTQSLESGSSPDVDVLASSAGAAAGGGACVAAGVTAAAAPLCAWAGSQIGSAVEGILKGGGGCADPNQVRSSTGNALYPLCGGDGECLNSMAATVEWFTEQKNAICLRFQNDLNAAEMAQTMTDVTWRLRHDAGTWIAKAKLKQEISRAQGIIAVANATKAKYLPRCSNQSCRDLVSGAASLWALQQAESVQLYGTPANQIATTALEQTMDGYIGESSTAQTQSMQLLALQRAQAESALQAEATSSRNKKLFAIGLVTAAAVAAVFLVGR